MFVFRVHTKYHRMDNEKANSNWCYSVSRPTRKSQTMAVALFTWFVKPQAKQKKTGESFQQVSTCFKHTCRILQILQVYTYLVGGFNHLEKYESQWEGLSHILWKSMFETTNQYIYIYHIIHAWIEQWPKVPPFWLPSHWLRGMQPPERANGVDTSHEKTVQLGTSKHQGESQKPCPYNVGLYMGNIPVT